MDKKVLLSSFIILLMVTSIAGFIFIPQDNSGNSEKRVYDGIEFVRTNDRWFTTVNNNQYSILISPDQLSKQNSINLNDLRRAQKIYISVNPKNNLQRILPELNYFLSFVNTRIVSSCYLDIPECRSLTLKTCKDATELNKVIVIKTEENTKISYTNNCLQMIGTESEIVKFIDELIVSVIKNE